MKKFGLFFLCVIFCSAFSTRAGADYEKGVEARAKGDYAGALDQWMMSSDDLRCMTAIGALYDSRYNDGEGILKDDAKAAEWYARAAEKGEYRAIAQLASFSLTGAGGVERNPAKWRRELEGIAGKDAYADYVLAMFYLNGHGGGKNFERAHSLLSALAEKGHTQLTPLLRQAERRLADKRAGVLEADTLTAELARNPASFDRSYKDRRIAVSGWVSSLRPLDDRGYAIKFGAPEPSVAPRDNVLAVFYSPAGAAGAAAIGAVKAGDFVKLDGVYSGKHPFLLEDCAFTLFGCSLLEIVPQDWRH